MNPIAGFDFNSLSGFRVPSGTGFSFCLLKRSEIHVSYRYCPAALFAAAIELPFFKFPFRRLIVDGAPFLGAFFAVGFSTSKRTIIIVAAGIARMGQKEYSAVTASLQAGAKMGMLSNHGTKLP